MGDSVARGLTTVALLKVNYDANVDDLDLYMPFALDTLKAWPGDAFRAEDLTAEISSRHGLKIPVEAVRTLLNRISKKGHLRRDYGRFFRNLDKPIDVDLLPQRQAIEREHTAVARRLIEFARAHRMQLVDEDEALGLILGFLEVNEVAILVEPGPEALATAAEQQSTRELRTVALFIRKVLDSEPAFAEYVQRMLEGLILQNALLLKNINLKRRQFKDLEVFFDTSFLFRAMGLASAPSVSAAREALTVLRQVNARISVFSKTIEEMQRVLAAIERLIGTPAGIRELRPTGLIRFLIAGRYRPSDVAKASALLDRNIRQLGFTVRSLPRRIPRYTLDEGDLARCLMREGQTDIDPRVDHDVNVVAAVLTLRAGRISYSLDDARAIFATPTSLVVKNVTKWYRGQQLEGVPPLIHQIGLSNIAWLKNPGDVATQLKRHELVAMCAAALRPTPQMWKRFTDELRRLKDSGDLTSDEEIAVLTSRLTDARLAEVEDEDDVDADTVVDIVERVRESYAEEVATATERALRSGEEKRQLELRIIRNTNLIAGWVGRVCYWGLGVIVAVGIVLSLPGLGLTSSFWAQVLAGVVLAIFALLNFVDLHTGLSVAHLRKRLESYVARKLTSWWLGRPEAVE